MIPKRRTKYLALGFKIPCCNISDSQERQQVDGARSMPDLKRNVGYSAIARLSPSTQLIYGIEIDRNSLTYRLCEPHLVLTTSIHTDFESRGPSVRCLIIWHVPTIRVYI